MWRARALQRARMTSAPLPKAGKPRNTRRIGGLGAMNSSSAYALGFNGQAVAVGVMDSDALLEKHPDLAGSRFHASEASSVYGSTGDRYPQSWSSPGRYEAGKSVTESGVIDGNWIAGTNDAHGMVRTSQDPWVPTAMDRNFTALPGVPTSGLDFELGSDGRRQRKAGRGLTGSKARSRAQSSAPTCTNCPSTGLRATRSGSHFSLSILR